MSNWARYHRHENMISYVFFFSRNSSLLYHSFVFFIISLSEAVYLRSFDGMCDGFVFDIHTHVSLF